MLTPNELLYVMQKHQLTSSDLDPGWLRHKPMSLRDTATKFLHPCYSRPNSIAGACTNFPSVSQKLLQHHASKTNTYLEPLGILCPSNLIPSSGAS